jgi:hypothetical protein
MTGSSMTGGGQVMGLLVQWGGGENGDVSDVLVRGVVPCPLKAKLVGFSKPHCTLRQSGKVAYRQHHCTPAEFSTPQLWQRIDAPSSRVVHTHYIRRAAWGDQQHVRHKGDDLGCEYPSHESKSRKIPEALLGMVQFLGDTPPPIADLCRRRVGMPDGVLSILSFAPLSHAVVMNTAGIPCTEWLCPRSGWLRSFSNTHAVRSGYSCDDG